MTYTSHGHFIPGSSSEYDFEKIEKGSCEGPGLCAACTVECLNLTGEPVEGYIYPAFVDEGNFVLKLVGIARLDRDAGRVTITYSPKEKEENANQAQESQDRG